MEVFERPPSWQSELSQIAPTRSRRDILLGAVASASVSAVARPGRQQTRILPALRWLAFYGEYVDETLLMGYDLAILDPGYRGSVRDVSERGTSVYGYLSVGEVRSTDNGFLQIDSGTLLTENANWPGTWIVDVRAPAWRRYLLDHAVPALIDRGFSELMLDTLDTPPYLEQQEPERYRGMASAAVDLVRAISDRYQKFPIIVNRAYAILPSLTTAISAVIAESLLTRPTDVAAEWLSAADVNAQLELLEPARLAGLPILSLDYWPLDDADAIALIYRRERSLGHHPYVSRPLLDAIVPEPGDRSRGLGARR